MSALMNGTAHIKLWIIPLAIGIGVILKIVEYLIND